MFQQPRGPLHPVLSESTERITPCNLASSWSHVHTNTAWFSVAECDPPVCAPGLTFGSVFLGGIVGMGQHLCCIRKVHTCAHYRALA